MGFGGENSQHKRGVAPWVLAGFVIAIIWASIAAAAPAQPDHGEKLARHWCASCHIVANDQKAVRTPLHPSRRLHGSRIRRRQNRTVPDGSHPKMPDMQLSRDEAKDWRLYRRPSQIGPSSGDRPSLGLHRVHIREQRVDHSGAKLKLWHLQPFVANDDAFGERFL